MTTPHIFITGTDTGVGKTVLTAALLAHYRAQGKDAVPMKPVQTGCIRQGDELIAPDIRFCLDSVPIPLEAEMTPYRYEPACSPHLAAGQCGDPIQIDHIISCYQKLASIHERVIVEGAGGLLVPLNQEETMLDLIRAMKLPVLIAARPGLGTINHTLLTRRALEQADVSCLGVVFIQSTPDRDETVEADNKRIVTEMSGLPVYGPLRYMPGLSKGTVDPEIFPEQVQRDLAQLFI